jgi:hypothetical protein
LRPPAIAVVVRLVVALVVAPKDVASVVAIDVDDIASDVVLEAAPSLLPDASVLEESSVAPLTPFLSAVATAVAPLLQASAPASEKGAVIGVASARLSPR